jgi:UDP-3-O-[3-hydroxymyristoyl] glucosamine N-acyltransferase
MEFSARQIADVLEGEIVGKSDIKVNRFSKIEEGEEGAISFLANLKYAQYLYTTKSSVVIIAKDFEPEAEVGATLILVDDPKQSFTQLLAFYHSMRRKKSGFEDPHFVDETATLEEGVYIGAFSYVGRKAEIGKNVKIYPNCYIGDGAVIGDNSTIFSGTRIYEGCKVGSKCTLHSGVIIGGDGFGFAPNGDERYDKVYHIGNVVIEDHVEIGANTTVDRATMGSTVIGKGVKLDNLIQIAHNVTIGENTVIAAQTGIAGSTKIGKNCMIGGQVGIDGHLTIGDNVKIAAQSGIGKSLQDNEIVQGSPAFSIIDYQRAYVMFRKLPELAKKINALTQQLTKGPHG